MDSGYHMRNFLRKARHFLWNAIKVAIIFVLLGILVAGCWFYFQYARPILALKSRAAYIAENSSEEDFKSGLTSIIYDCNGEKITSLRSGRASYYLTYEEIPKVAVDVMLVTEDKKFYSHEGVDYLANLRALLALIKHEGKITQGGSTITQQLARTIYLTNEVTYERKLIEVFLAWELEEKYTKHEILEYYFNNIYFSNGYYGIQAAAYGYFGRSVKELSLSEIVFLCAIPNNPSLYDPQTHMDKTLERRDRMLDQMLEDGKITETECVKAKTEEMVLEHQTVSRHNYAETYIRYCAVRALMQANGFTFCNTFSSEQEREEYEALYESSYSYWQQKMYIGGYRIYTSIDLQKQELLQDAINQGTAEFQDVTEDGIYELQAAAVCIDNETGYVVAIVGGREQEYAGYTLNRAYQSFRQPGSAIKPLIIYTPWMERGLTPDSLVRDEKFEGGPRNAGSYLGVIDVRTAVKWSKNTVAWKLFEELSYDVGLSYLKKMNFKKIVDTDYVPAAALGGLTYGASPLEMASAYAALEHDGIFRDPTCIVRITDSDGKDVVKDTITELQVYEKNAARSMTSVLQDVVKSGTGRKSNLETAIAAGKTGTTDDKKDGWFIGYTTYYTTSVWVGCDMPKTVNNLSGSTYPQYIWKDYMDQIHEGLSVEEFASYEEVPSAYIAPDITPTPIPSASHSKEDSAGEYRVTATPIPKKEEDAKQYQITPIPTKAAEEEPEEEYDPTKDPVYP